MGPTEHQRKLDERYAVETELIEAVRWHGALLKQLEEQNVQLHERMVAVEKVIEALLEKWPRSSLKPKEAP